MESAENREQSPKTNQQAAESSDSPSLSKIETLKLLNDSIDRLEETIKGISQTSANKLPSSTSINTLVTTTQELAEAVVTPSPDTPNSTPQEPDTSGTNAKSEPEGTAVEPNTPLVIPPEPVEPVEPQPVVKEQKKRNLGLIALGVTAIAIALGAVFWLWLPRQQVTLSPNPESVPTEIAIVNESNPDLEATEPSVIDSETNPQVNIVAENLPTEPEVANPELETSDNDISIPEDLAYPGKVKNLKVATIEPELSFTPEQTLIAALQTKVLELIKDSPTDLVDFIKVDLAKSSLLVKVKDNWYELNESRQNKLANDILERSRQLNFSKLELQDSQGTLVARNPVIGDQIIILQSHKNDEPLDKQPDEQPDEQPDKELDQQLTTDD
ncbi:MAG: hypothetical protein QNJ53_06865 [Pleurocapsa sp. MO_192.B19]|nr:hypothetical protein [Pleurocapsa sp. MO_192.B19]